MVGQGQVLVLIVILVIGIAFGAGVAWWMLSSRKSNAAPDAPASAPDEMAVLRGRYTEQAGLWHEKTSGKLVLRIGSQMLDQADQLNTDQRTRLQTLTRELLTWMGAPPAAAAAPAIILPPPAPDLSKPAQPVQRPLPPPPVSAATPAASTPAKTKSIVEQIDDILQDKLTHSTSSQKGVRLVEDATHGVVVWIGLDHYNGVDRVTDPEVRALLREAAEEWERRATPSKK